MWLLVAPGWQCEREWARNGSVNGNGPGIGIVKGDGPGQQGWQWERERARTTKGQIQEMGYRKLAESLQEVCRPNMTKRSDTINARVTTRSQRRDQAGNRSDRLHHVTQPEARKYARVVASYTVSRETVALEGEGTGRDWSKRHQWGAADDESGSDIVTCDLMVPGMERPKCRIASL
ncbi:hypothetical protein Bbelb_413620 [Branchiostoma belcheri]|nr:hypothetical protein Bbelb_413620 [Branchiostoma belcheri]